VCTPGGCSTGRCRSVFNESTSGYWIRLANGDDFKFDGNPAAFRGPAGPSAGYECDLRNDWCCVVEVLLAGGDGRDLGRRFCTVLCLADVVLALPRSSLALNELGAGVVECRKRDRRNSGGVCCFESARIFSLWVEYPKTEVSVYGVS
jgi:hypothetical protein